VKAREGVSEGITLDDAKRQIRMLRARLQEMSLALANSHHSGGRPAAPAPLPGELEEIKKAVMAGQCSTCVDLIDRCQALAQENSNLRAQMGSLVASPNKRSFLETMLSPFVGKGKKGSSKKDPSSPSPSPSPVKGALALGTALSPLKVPAASSPIISAGDGSRSPGPSSKGGKGSPSG
jgi:hypothetical protein